MTSPALQPRVLVDVHPAVLPMGVFALNAVTGEQVPEVFGDSYARGFLRADARVPALATVTEDGWVQPLDVAQQPFHYIAAPNGEVGTVFRYPGLEAEEELPRQRDWCIYMSRYHALKGKEHADMTSYHFVRRRGVCESAAAAGAAAADLRSYFCNPVPVSVITMTADTVIDTPYHDPVRESVVQGLSTDTAMKIRDLCVEDLLALRCCVNTLLSTKSAVSVVTL